MKTRGAEVILAASLLTVTAGCADNHESSYPQSAAKADTPHAKLVSTGKELLKNILADPNQDPPSKPIEAVSVTKSLRNGAKISYMVQTLTKAYNPNQIDAITVRQSGKGVDNFELNFLLRNDGTWNMYCYDNESPSGVIKSSVSELGESKADLDFPPNEVTYGADVAKALFSDEVTHLPELLTADKSTPLTTPCHPNIG